MIKAEPKDKIETPMSLVDRAMIWKNVKLAFMVGLCASLLYLLSLVVLIIIFALVYLAIKGQLALFPKVIGDTSAKSYGLLKALWAFPMLGLLGSYRCLLDLIVSKKTRIMSSDYVVKNELGGNNLKGENGYVITFSICPKIKIPIFDRLQKEINPEHTLDIEFAKYSKLVFRVRQKELIWQNDQDFSLNWRRPKKF